jgi:endonuclease YncB( thermonuclease family)
LTLPALFGLTGCEHIGLSDPYEDAPQCAVSKVIDGDSVMLQCAGKAVEVRLYCLDAPEMSQKPWGKRSREHLWGIMPDQVLMIAHDTDRYGRTVAELISADEAKENINLLQVYAGYAAVYRRYCKLKEYYRAEERARDIKSGIWESRGLHREPWKYRRNQQR